VVVSGGPEEEGENAYAAALLADFLILIGWAQWQVIPTVCYHYLGCVLVLQLFGGGREERESNELQNGHFYRVSGSIPT
jgi:hypothetical protein